MTVDFLVPEWPAPARVRAVQTTRGGGVSTGPYASLNLGSHVGDDAGAVAYNRRLLESRLPARPRWLNQVHGTAVVDAAIVADGATADAVLATCSATVCAVMTADCLPVLFCSDDGTAVAAAHAGWRGLAAGILEQTVSAMPVTGERLLAWLGPAIGPTAFEVGDEVRQEFLAKAPEAATAFVAQASGKWLADIYALARQRLAAAGVTRVYGGEWCTVNDGSRFFSYRRDGVTGRMATLIWLA